MRLFNHKTSAFALPLVLAIVGVTTVLLGYFLSRSMKSVSIEGTKSKSNFQRQKMEGEMTIVSQRLLEKIDSWVFDPEPTYHGDAILMDRMLRDLAASFTEYDVRFECLWEGAGLKCNNRKGPYPAGFVPSNNNCTSSAQGYSSTDGSGSGGGRGGGGGFCRPYGVYSSLPKVFRIEMSVIDDDGNWNKLVKTVSISKVSLAEYAMMVTNSPENIRLGPATFDAPVFLNFDLNADAFSVNPPQILLDNTVAPISFNKTFETNIDSSQVNPVSTTDNAIFYGQGASYNDTSVDTDAINHQIQNIAGNASNWNGTSENSDLTTVEFISDSSGCSLRISETVGGNPHEVESNLVPSQGQVIVLNGPVEMITNNNPWCRKTTFYSDHEGGVRLRGSLLATEGNSAGLIATSGDITIADNAIALDGNPLASRDTSASTQPPVTFQIDFALYSARQALKLDPSYLAPGANQIGVLATTGTYISRELPFYANQNSDGTYNGFETVQRSFNPLLSNEDTAAPGFNQGTRRVRLREIYEAFSSNSDLWY